MKNFNIIIITGRSGSGKSTAINALEDAGFYCVDNLPVALLPLFLEQQIDNASEIAGFAFVMDLREKGFLSTYALIFESLKRQGYTLEIIFLEAAEEVLLRRYSQTRRHHPLARGKSLLEGIRSEETELLDLRKSSDRVIDTSHFNVHELRSIILDIAKKCVKFSPIRIQILSFGFKYGVPNEADLVLDVRFLSNPFFINELRNMDGETEEVRHFVLQAPEAGTFLQKCLNLLDYLIPLYEKEGKAYLTIAVGCTGGRHRSVVIARSLFDHFSKSDKQIDIAHRDIEQ